MLSGWLFDPVSLLASEPDATIRSEFRPGPGACFGMVNYRLGEWAAMQTSLIIESNGSGKEKLEDLLRDGWTVQSVTANHGKSYNDFLVVLQK